MKKIFSFSLLLILGLVASQILPGMLGESYPAFRAGATTFLYVCLSFIMINVGREFEIDKKRWRSYAEDYFIAMATAAVPWLLIALYYVFVLLPPEFWGNGDAWKENLLLSRFAAPTSAGILFTMLGSPTFRIFLPEFMDGLSFTTQFDVMQRGIIEFRNIIFMLVIGTGFLIASITMLEERKAS